MNHEMKTGISEALAAYLKHHNMSQPDLAKHTKVNVAYINSILKRTFEVSAGNGKQVAIAAKWFRKIADHIGYEIQKGTALPVRKTHQLIQCLSYLQDSLKYGYFTIIIGETGCGKTFSSNVFAKAHPLDVTIVTVSASDTLPTLLDKIREGLGLPLGKTRDKRLRDIVLHLKKQKEESRNPVIIFDECEFMKLPTLCMMKELYDFLKSICGIVMCGTPELITNIERLRARNTPGMAQFYRRVKFAIRWLTPIDPRFPDFVAEYDKPLQRFLQSICTNYGELNDVLVPAMRESERTGEPLTENLIRRMLCMPPAKAS